MMMKSPSKQSSKLYLIDFNICRPAFAPFLIVMASLLTADGKPVEPSVKNNSSQFSDQYLLNLLGSTVSSSFSLRDTNNEPVIPFLY